MSGDQQGVDPRAAEKALRHESDELLDAMDEMRKTERRKRTEMPTTPTFHALADKVERQAKQVFEIAQREDDLGEAIKAVEDDHGLIDGEPPMRPAEQVPQPRRGSH